MRCVAGTCGVAVNLPVQPFFVVVPPVFNHIAMVVLNIDHLCLHAIVEKRWPTPAYTRYAAITRGMTLPG